ncbi:lactosylceramide 4-alpha-galactosyltransferase-like [Hemiscyllium ocellatum]|uniref:lactosylceramide 4-alpha-galactosyltransferase-like n=1 Tax=Hemiscyllium ocellatum TaxID=170820 RepID=UPI0029662F77|nr:lactosylceramide 4-alpha-galactosyltransferase-like [Hemiscyllium ocellatum]
MVRKVSHFHSKLSDEEQQQQQNFIKRYLVLKNKAKNNCWCKLWICSLILLKLISLTLLLYYRGGAQSLTVKYRLSNDIKCPSIDFNYDSDGDSQTHDNTTIFFVEVSDRTNPTFLSLCSLESAARSHPQAKIAFYMKGLSATKVKTFGISLLNCFPNIEIRPLDLKNLFVDTPLSSWYSSLHQWWQPYLIPTIADACRLVLLWKYGGIYLDTDIIVLKNLLNLTNSLGREEQYLLNTAFLSFDRGHDFIGNCLKNFVEHFNGWIWGHQGPQLVTRVLKKWCQKKSIAKIQQCKGVRMLPPEAFYPVRWQDWKKYFEVMSKSEVQKLLKNSYAVHIWNKMSHGTSFPMGSKVMIDQLSSVYCPISYKIMSWQET